MRARDPGIDRRPGRLAPAGMSLLAALVLLAVVAAVAPAAGQDGDVYLDPLAFNRPDPEARDLPVTVVMRAEEGRRTENGRMLLQGSEEIYLRSAAAATLLKATRLWQEPLRMLTFRVGDQSFQLTAGSRLVRNGDQETLLPVPVLAFDGDVWLPMDFLVRVLGPMIGEAVIWEPEERRLTLGSASFNVVGLRVQTLTRATAVHIQCREALSYRADSSEPGYIILKIYGGEVDAGRVQRGGRQGLVESVSSRQFSDHAKIYVKVDDLVTTYRTYTRQDGREIVLVLEEEQPSAIPEPQPHGRVSMMVDQAPRDVTHPIDVRTVVIDPGHGGVETGRVGHDGTLEKDVNLAVALELKRYLEREGRLDVVLTRDEDVQLDLDDRAEIANKAQGDLFVSLHCNGWFNDSAAGVETYFLSPAKSEYSQGVADAENDASAGVGGGDDPIAFILWDLVQNRFISSSSDLAEIVQATICREAEAPDRGVKQAGFRVLVGAHMPAVLVEMGFLSHEADERRLRDRSYQRKLARALGEAVLEYRERHSRPEISGRDGDRDRREDDR